MIAVQKGSSDKTGPDEQKRVFLLAVEPHQGHHANDQRQKRGGRLHQGVKLTTAPPLKLVTIQEPQCEQYSEDPIDP